MMNDSQTVRCSLCGVENVTSNAACSGCGAPLGTKKFSQPSTVQSKLPHGVKIKKSSSPSITHRERYFFAAGVIVGLLVMYLFFNIDGSSSVAVRPGPEASPLPGGQAGQMNVEPSLLAELQSLENQYKANPNDPALLLSFANTLHDARMMPRAVEIYKKYLALKPDDVDARVDMGICYFELGDLQSAMKEMKTGIQTAPRHQKAVFNLGIVTLNAGDAQEAIKLFKKSIEIDPKTQIAQRAGEIIQRHSSL